MVNKISSKIWPKFQNKIINEDDLEFICMV